METMETMENKKNENASLLRKVGEKAKEAGVKTLTWMGDHPYAAAVIGSVSVYALGVYNLYKHNGANKKTDDWQMCVYRSEPGTKLWKYQRHSPVFHPSKEDAETILESTKDWKSLR